MRPFRKKNDKRKKEEIFGVFKRLLELAKGRKEIGKRLFKIKNKQTIRKVFTFLKKRKVTIDVAFTLFLGNEQASQSLPSALPPFQIPLAFPTSFLLPPSPILLASQPFPPPLCSSLFLSPSPSFWSYSSSSFSLLFPPSSSLLLLSSPSSLLLPPISLFVEKTLFSDEEEGVFSPLEPLYEKEEEGEDLYFCKKFRNFKAIWRV